MSYQKLRILNIIDDILGIALLIVIGINVAILLLNQHTLSLIGG